jgi:hypothetical protein
VRAHLDQLQVGLVGGVHGFPVGEHDPVEADGVGHAGKAERRRNIKKDFPTHFLHIKFHHSPLLLREEVQQVDDVPVDEHVEGQGAKMPGGMEQVQLLLLDGSVKNAFAKLKMANKKLINI